MITPPTRAFDIVARIDLGPVVAVLSYHGRGHIDGDIVVTVSEVSFGETFSRRARHLTSTTAFR